MQQLERVASSPHTPSVVSMQQCQRDAEMQRGVEYTGGKVALTPHEVCCEPQYRNSFLPIWRSAIRWVYATARRSSDTPGDDLTHHPT